MLKKIAAIIAVLLMATCLFAVGIVGSLTYNYPISGEIYNYVHSYFESEGEYVYNTCHRSIGKVTADHQVVFKDISINIRAALYGIRTTLTLSGSGFYFDKKLPLLLTNYHVVATPTADQIGNLPEHTFITKFSLTMDDGTVYPATLVATFPEKDMAILLVNTKEWKTLSIGNTDDLHVGDKVYAIGTPLGIFNNSITDGIVSAKDRDVIMVMTGQNYPAQDLRGWIQHSAHVNPGNSGGPLVNCYGEVVGINTISLNQPNISGIYLSVNINLFDFENPKYWYRATPEETLK